MSNRYVDPHAALRMELTQSPHFGALVNGLDVIALANLGVMPLENWSADDRALVGMWAKHGGETPAAVTEYLAPIKRGET